MQGIYAGIDVYLLIFWLAMHLRTSKSPPMHIIDMQSCDLEMLPREFPVACQAEGLGVSASGKMLNKMKDIKDKSTKECYSPSEHIKYP